MRSEKPTNGSTLVQTNRFVSATSLNVAPYHIPKGKRAIKYLHNIIIIFQNLRKLLVVKFFMPLIKYFFMTGTAAVANISVPKGKVSTPLVRTTPVPPAQSVTTGSSCSTST